MSQTLLLQWVVECPAWVVEWDQEWVAWVRAAAWEAAWVLVAEDVKPLQVNAVRNASNSD